jgi:hypothetical protein
MLLKKFVGKPYAGKLHVRFDEGAGKVLNAFPLYSTLFGTFASRQKDKKKTEIHSEKSLKTLKALQYIKIIFS